jgi:hypothetical protein
VSADLQLPASVSVPIVLSGNGTIHGPSASVTVQDLTITPGTTITASGLILTGRFAIQGNSWLAPLPGTSIEWANTLRIVFIVTDGQVPSFDLGAIHTLRSNAQNTLPQSIEIVGLDTGGSATEPRTLISGRTLEKCEEWKALVRLDSTAFTIECRDTSAGRAKLLAGDSFPEISLVLVPLVTPSATAPKTSPGPKSNVGLIVGIAVGGVAVVGIVVALVCRRFVKKRGDISGGTGGSWKPVPA